MTSWPLPVQSSIPISVPIKGTNVPKGGTVSDKKWKWIFWTIFVIAVVAVLFLVGWAFDWWSVGGLIF